MVRSSRLPVSSVRKWLAYSKAVFTGASNSASMRAMFPTTCCSAGLRASLEMRSRATSSAAPRLLMRSFSAAIAFWSGSSTRLRSTLDCSSASSFISTASCSLALAAAMVAVRRSRLSLSRRTEPSAAAVSSTMMAPKPIASRDPILSLRSTIVTLLPKGYYGARPGSPPRLAREVDVDLDGAARGPGVETPLRQRLHHRAVEHAARLRLEDLDSHDLARGVHRHAGLDRAFVGPGLDRLTRKLRIHFRNQLHVRGGRGRGAHAQGEGGKTREAREGLVPHELLP